MQSSQPRRSKDIPISAAVDVTTSDLRKHPNLVHLLESPHLLCQLSQVTCRVGPRVPVKFTADMLCYQLVQILRHTDNLRNLTITNVYKENIFAALARALCSSQNGLVMDLWPRLARMNLQIGLRAPWIEAGSISNLLALSPNLKELVIRSSFAPDQVQIGHIALKNVTGHWAALHAALVAPESLYSVTIEDPNGGGTWGFDGVLHALGAAVPHPALRQVVAFKMTVASAPSSGISDLFQHLTHLQDLTIPLRPTLNDGDDGLFQALQALPRHGLRSLTVVSQYDFGSGPGPYGMYDAHKILQTLERLEIGQNRGVWWLRRLRFAFLRHIDYTDANRLAGVLGPWCRSHRVVLVIG